MKVLMTGGSGFLGRAIVRELSKPPESAVCSPDEIRLFDVEATSGGGDGVVPIVGDVCDYAAVLRACRDIDVVVHAASLVDWGRTTPARLDEVNVGGTRNILRACREAGVSALVYTSSMDVVCGSKPVLDADESTPFPSSFTSEYARTKAVAEQLVLEANGARRAALGGKGASGAGLATCAVRPCGMFGEGDPYHVANVLRVMRERGLPFRPGSGRASFQHVYVGNVAHAHALAMRSLLEPESRVAGEAYFVTDDTPAVNFFVFMEPILEALGHPLPPRSRRIPYPVMFALGAALEGVAVVCRPFFQMTPTLTRSSVRFVCHDHTFNGEKARRDLGYEPIYKEAESIERTIEYFRSQLG